MALSSLRVVAFASLIAVQIAAQVQVPANPRHVHPHIAPFAIGGATTHGSGPLFQIPDALWNHGEGFVVPATNEVDVGGWHGLDDGTAVRSGDIFSAHQRVPNYPFVNWHRITLGTEQIDRFVGYLRPQGTPFPVPQTHPRYPNHTAPYVDQAAFEIFRPLTAWTQGQKIVILINNYSTWRFPRVRLANDELRSFDWRQTYCGFFSPDGLDRDEASVNDGFASNIEHNTVRRGDTASLIFSWPKAASTYYPIVGSATLTIHGRQSELVQQRNLQLVQAVKELLMENPNLNRNPIGQQLTQAQIDTDVIVVFTGGSNGGLQSFWATMTAPHVVHGGFARVVNPSIQRLFGEQELGYAVSTLSGSNHIGADLDPFDFMNWGHFSWNRGLQIHDLSWIRRFMLGQTFRPMGFYISDEDISSTGTDWIRMLTGTTYQAFGEVPGTFGGWLSPNNTFSWMVSPKYCHDQGPFPDPYNGGVFAFDYFEATHSFCKRAVSARIEQGTNPLPAAITALQRQAGEDLRGADDPHEWFFGRQGQPESQTGSALVHDDSFFQATQPGSAGTWLGNKESILIHDQKVFVGSAEGLVSSFRVDWTHPQQPLIKVDQSPQLGHQAWGMTKLEDQNGWHLIVGTRRHLYKLNPDLSIAATSPILPWEVAKPYRLRVGEFLSGNPNKEICFAAVHGGLVFYDVSLNPVREWPEPGIVDYVAQGSTLSLLSDRGVVANVQFDSSDVARLHAASPTQQGSPIDLELVNLRFDAIEMPILAALYGGDEHRLSLRVFNPLTCSMIVPPIPNLDGAGNVRGRGGVSEITTVKHNTQAGIGDHVLLLANDTLLLFNQFAALVGRKDLTSSRDQNGMSRDYLFGVQACSVAVGDLGANQTGEYREQLVVGTQAGRLMWMHVEELLGTTENRLPPQYTMQPPAHTNDSLSATWAMTTRTGDSDLHVLDQSGTYWRVPFTGPKSLIAGEHLAGGARGWDFVTQPTGPSPGLSVAQSEVSFLTLAPGFGAVTTNPWGPKSGAVAIAESYGMPSSGNWSRHVAKAGFLQGFISYRWGGATIQTAQGASQSWFWSDAEPANQTTDQQWPNFVQGLEIQNALISGLWHSTAHGTATPASNLPFFHLRHFEPARLPVMESQGLRAVHLNGQTYVVLGCPGGGVRVVVPGSMRVDSLGPHVLGTLHEAAFDLGHGACALAVRAEASLIRIWVGTLYDHCSRGTYPTGPLQSIALASGRVHEITFTPGSGGSGFAYVREVPGLQASNPSDPPAYGITGLAVADLISGSPQEDELIVTTLSGDLFVFSTSSYQQLYRAHLHGALGFYNSIVVADLNGNGTGERELYVSGSHGLRRFTHPTSP